MPNTSLPVTLRLQGVPHYRQTQASDCLAACVAIVLDYLGRPMPYVDLITLLEIGPIGAPRRNVLQLTQVGLKVSYREATLSIVTAYLQAGLPVIAFVDTGELPYWSASTNHVVVIIGIDEENVVLKDPAFDTEVQIVPRGDFELAWLECDNVCVALDL